MNNTHHWVTWSFGAPGPNAFPFRSLCVSIQVSSHRCCPVTASPEHLFTMSASSKQSLSAQWKSAQHGRLCAWEMAKVLGLREASKELHGGKPNMTWIAARVTKHGGGNPTQQAMRDIGDCNHRKATESSPQMTDHLHVVAGVSIPATARRS